MKVFEKIADLLGKMNGLVLLAAALGIVLVVFVIGLIAALGGELGKFKRLAKKAIAKPTAANFQQTAKDMPVRVRKQYKKAKQSGEKPSDVITVDACVYRPFRSSAAARFPGAVMAAGILAALLSFFLMSYVKPTKMMNVEKGTMYYYLIPDMVTVGVMLLRLFAGLISSAVLKSGVRVYTKYVDTLDANLHGGAAREEEQPQREEQRDEVPFVRPDETPVHADTYEATFDAPTHISVELADEEEEQPEQSAPQATVFEPVAEQQESEAEMKARARAEAMARMRAEQQAAQAKAAAQAEPEPVIAAEPEPAPAGLSSADEVIARIDRITKEGATLAQMKEVALQLQKERAKPENKTPECQQKLNKALAALLKSMSGVSRK